MDNKLKWKAILDICQCGKGWHNLISETLSKIEAIYQENNISMSDDFEILQIKQKFGELIIYTKSSLRKEIDEVIQAARIKSIQVCEKCSATGRIYKQGNWRITTLCKKCAEFEEFDTSFEKPRCNGGRGV